MLAVGQFCWGASQPLFGLLAERIGTRDVLLIGALLLGGGLSLAPLAQGRTGLMLTLGICSAVGAGAGPFSS